MTQPRRIRADGETGVRRALTQAAKQLNKQDVSVPAAAEAGGSTPTKAEFDALVAKVNALETVLRGMKVIA